MHVHQVFFFLGIHPIQRPPLVHPSIANTDVLNFMKQNQCEVSMETQKVVRMRHHIHIFLLSFSNLYTIKAAFNKGRVRSSIEEVVVAVLLNGYYRG